VTSSWFFIPQIGILFTKFAFWAEDFVRKPTLFSHHILRSEFNNILDNRNNSALKFRQVLWWYS